MRLNLRDDREEMVLLAKACGETFAHIGQYLGVSASRAQQLYQRGYKRITISKRLMHVKVLTLPSESAAREAETSTRTA